MGLQGNLWIIQLFHSNRLWNGFRGGAVLALLFSQCMDYDKTLMTCLSTAQLILILLYTSIRLWISDVNIFWKCPFDPHYHWTITFWLKWIEFVCDQSNYFWGVFYPSLGCPFEDLGLVCYDRIHKTLLPKRPTWIIRIELTHFCLQVRFCKFFRQKLKVVWFWSYLAEFFIWSSDGFMCKKL